MFFLAGFRLLPPRSVSFQPPRRRRGLMGNREGDERTVASARFGGKGELGGAPGIYTRSFGNTFGRQM